MVATPWSTDQRKCSGDCSKRDFDFSGIGDTPLYLGYFLENISWIKFIRYILWLLDIKKEILWNISYYNDTLFK